MAGTHVDPTTAGRPSPINHLVHIITRFCTMSYGCAITFQHNPKSSSAKNQIRRGGGHCSCRQACAHDPNTAHLVA